ncbi:unnamed protein product [[Actinomadura] parvosata subsp. kistnae]|uniref:hypothetical protein n=1 Tax=[Actinomadura] parvosata TaxID=1955412 RepID=UPI000D27A31B|nr:unnamed protein product [Actinomadura parvosata subsp. kistnae]
MRWGRFRGRRLVLRDGEGEREVIECAALMKADMKREVSASPEVGLSREITWAVAGRSFLHYGQEYPYGSRFVMITGADRDEVGTLTRIVSEYFEPLEDAELLDAVVRAPEVEQRRAVLVRAGIGAPVSCEGAFLALITEAMRDQNARIREGGLWAAMYALWPELLPAVMELTVDPDKLLRAQADALVRYMRREGITP